MNFSCDRDLLLLEPGVFIDLPLLIQQRLRVTDGALSGATLSSAAADFVGAQVETGSVLLIASPAGGGAGAGGLPVCHEVVARVNAHTLTVSLPRTGTNDAPLPSPLAGGTGLEVVARTFAPQAALVHDLLLRLAGLDPDDAAAAVTEDAIVSLSLMARLEALGTLERVYAAAVSISDDADPLWRKWRSWQERFGAACRRAVVLLDADGDGVADQRRALGTLRLERV